MKTKFLETDCFKLEYPSDWSHEIDQQLHSIYNVQGIGAFQVSSIKSNSSEIKFDINKEKTEYENSIIKDYPNFKAIHFIDSISNPKFCITKWVLGKERIMIFCTYTISETDFETKSYRNEMISIENIIKTLEII